MEDVAAQDVEAEAENDIELPLPDCFDRFGREPLHETLGDRIHDNALNAFELHCAIEFRERVGILREPRSIPTLALFAWGKAQIKTIKRSYMRSPRVWGCANENDGHFGNQQFGFTKSSQIRHVGTNKCFDVVRMRPLSTECRPKFELRPGRFGPYAPKNAEPRAR